MKKKPPSKIVTGIMSCFIATGSVEAAISLDSSTYRTGPGGAISTVNFGSYDASGAGKLVVLVGGGRDRGSSLGINSVTYNGVAMDLAVKASSSDISPVGVATGIYYMDNPGAAGDLVVNFSAKSWGARNSVTILELSGALSGVGAVASSIDTAAVSFGTTAANSLVLAASKGVPDGFVETAQSPLSALPSGLHGAGSQEVAAISTVNPTFTAFSTDGGSTVAAEFLAVPTVVIPEPSSVALLGLGGIALLLRRRK